MTTPDMSSPLPTKFPRFLLRFKAAIWDGFFLSLVVYAAFLLPSLLGIEHIGAKAAFIAAVILLFEPLWVSVSGSTLGHHIAGLRVVSADTGSRLSLPRSIFRFLFRYVFGIYSFLTMLINRQHQALHDVLMQSLVVFRHPDTVAAHDVLVERDVDYTQSKPGIARRLFVFLVHWVLFVVGLVSLMSWLVTEKCLMQEQHCSTQEETAMLLAGIVFLIMTLGLFILAMHCHLPGTRHFGDSKSS